MIEKGQVKGVLFAIQLFLTSFLGVFICGFGLLPVFIFNPPLYRKLFDNFIAAWMCYCAALLELFLGIKPVITGDEIRSNEANLLIMNHRTRLDWMYLWQVLVRQSGVKTEKIILKSMLKHIPGAGWAMQVGAFIFLARKWEEDKENMHVMMEYFSHIKHKTQVLLFPEGTNLTDATKARSDAFAKKNNMELYERVLHPRVTGFTYLVEQMRNNDHIEAVYDITIGYPYNFPVTEPELVMGNFPKEVHFHVKRYAIEELPANEEGLQKWCQDVWKEKEAKLKEFYKNKNFLHEGNSGGDYNVNNNEILRRDPTVMLIVAIVYWTVFVVGILFLLCVSSLARWLALAQIVFFLYMSRTGGFELFQAKFYLKHFAQKLHKKST